MGTALAPRKGPRTYSYTPQGQPHLRVVVVPYNYTQLLDPHGSEMFNTCGHQITDWRLVLDHDPRWIFVIDTNKKLLDPERDYVQDCDFDFRSMMSTGA